MSISFGNLRYTTSGRKRKPLPKAHGYTPKFQPLEPVDTYRRETPEYKSVPDTNSICTMPDRSYTKGSRYTIAPAYNKGAYQVISQENIKDIGR
jgi:hypothetical protein